MSRRLLNDPTLAAAIERDFVPVSGAVEDLQVSRYGAAPTPASRWFEPMAQAALKRFAPPNWWKEFKTYQGLYVVGADGSAYHYKVVWKVTPTQYLADLKGALARFRARPPKRVKLDPQQAGAWASPHAKASESVLRVLARVGKPKRAGTEAHQGIGRDHMWIYADEVRALVRAASRVGVDVPLPKAITGRLVRFHLLDHSRNVSEPFGERDVSTAAFTIRRTGGAGRKIEFALRGRYASQGNGTAHGQVPFGVEGSLDGVLTIDATRAKITRFRAHGAAVAWGQPKTGAPVGRYPIAFAIVSVDPRARTVVVPVWLSLSRMAGKGSYKNPKVAILD